MRLSKCWWGQTSLRKSWKTAGLHVWSTLLECPLDCGWAPPLSIQTHNVPGEASLVFIWALLLDPPTVTLGTGSSWTDMATASSAARDVFFRGLGLWDSVQIYHPIAFCILVKWFALNKTEQTGKRLVCWESMPQMGSPPCLSLPEQNFGLSAFLSPCSWSLINPRWRFLAHRAQMKGSVTVNPQPGRSHPEIIWHFVKRELSEQDIHNQAPDGCAWRHLNFCQTPARVPFPGVTCSTVRGYCSANIDAPGNWHSITDLTTHHKLPWTADMKDYLFTIGSCCWIAAIARLNLFQGREMNDTLRTQMETSDQSALSVQEAPLTAGFSHASSKEWCPLWDVLFCFGEVGMGWFSASPMRSVKRRPVSSLHHIWPTVGTRSIVWSVVLVWVSLNALGHILPRAVPSVRALDQYVWPLCQSLVCPGPAQWALRSSRWAPWAKGQLASRQLWQGPLTSSKALIPVAQTPGACLLLGLHPAPLPRLAQS